MSWGLQYPNTDGVVTDTYTINLYVKTTDFGVRQWARIIDFSDGQSDDGIYFKKETSSDNRCIDFYPNGIVGACPFFTNTDYYLLTFTRNGITGNINIYVNSVLFSTYNDVAGVYKGKKNKPIYIYRDDNAVSCESGEANFAYLSFSNIYSSQTDVNSTYNSICAIANTNVTDFTITPSTVCRSGDNATIKYTGSITAPALNYTFTWDWDGGNVVSGTGMGPFVVNWDTPGTKNIKLTVTSQTCTGNNSVSSSNSIIVNDIVSPAVNIAASQLNICAGSPVTFTATPTNGGTAPIYQWLVNGIATGSNSDTFVTNNINNGDKISCVLTSNANCLTTTNATSNIIQMGVTSSVEPGVTISASQNNICQGTPVTFTAVSSGTLLAYQWMVNGTKAGTDNAIFQSNSLVNGDIVNCTVKSAAPCLPTPQAVSNDITMNVAPQTAPAISIAASSTVICPGTNITFTSLSNNEGATPVYKWLVNGQDVNDNTPTYSSTTLSDNDVVTCQLTSSAKCAAPATILSNGVTITVRSTVVPVINITADASSPICQGTPVTFTAVITGGGTAPVYQWLVNGNKQGANTPTYSNNALNDGDVINCTLISNAGCANVTVNSNNITINTLPLNQPGISIAASKNNICSGDNVDLTATAINGGANPSYQWMLNGVAVGRDINTYSSSSLKNGDVLSCILTSDVPCRITSSATSNNIQMSVNTSAEPGISIAASLTSICDGTDVTFNALAVNGGSAPVYQWLINSVPVGTNSPVYSSNTLKNGDKINCVLTSNALCTTNPTVTSPGIIMTVDAVIKPQITISAGTSSICAGMPLTFTASAVNCGNSPKYDWQVNGQSINVNNYQYTSVSLNNGDVVSCNVSPDATAGCYTTMSVVSNVIKVDIGAIPTVRAGNDTVIYKGSSFLLQGYATGTIATYHWEPETYLSNSNIAKPLATPLISTKYTLHVITTDNCEATAEVNVKVLSQIIVPNTFTPNGDGINDTWKISGLADYNGATVDVYDRYGLIVFHVIGYKEWDGKLNGKPLPATTYYYIVNPKNNLPKLSGWVEIVR